MPGANWFPPRTDNTLRSAEESDVCGGEKEVTQQINYSILSCNQLTGVHGSTRSVRFLKNHVALKLLETRCSLLSCMYRQDASLHLRDEEGRRGGEGPSYNIESAMQAALYSDLYNYKSNCLYCLSLWYLVHANMG